MKKTLVLGALLIVAGSLSLAYAANVDKGKALFESPTLGNGTTGKSCKTCHAGGKGLGKDMFERKQFSIMGMGKKAWRKSSMSASKNLWAAPPLTRRGRRCWT